MTDVAGSDSSEGVVVVMGVLAEGVGGVVGVGQSRMA